MKDGKRRDGGISFGTRDRRPIIYERRCSLSARAERSITSGKSFPDIPRAIGARPDATPRFYESDFSQSPELSPRRIFFESARDSKVGRRRRWRLKGNRAEASMMKMYVTKCRKRVRARKFRVGCLPRMRGKTQLPSRGVAGRHLCNNSTRAVSTVLQFESELLFRMETKIRPAFIRDSTTGIQPRVYLFFFSRINERKPVNSISLLIRTMTLVMTR